MREIISDLKLLRIDVFSILIYYPLIRVVYALSKPLPFITPNLTTIFGLAQFLACTSAFLASESPIYLSIGLFVFAWMDVTDGFLARKKSLSSKAGAILDICSDRIVFFVFTAVLGWYFFKNSDTQIELLTLAAYSFLFIFLDTVHLISGQIKSTLDIPANKSKGKPNNRWWLNQEFRFTSYIFMCIWIATPAYLYFAWTAIALVAMDYLAFLNKSVKSLRAR